MKLIYFVIGVVIVIGGYFLWPNKAKGPVKNQSEASNVNQNTNKENNKVAEFKFPGVLPVEEIKNKKAVLTTSKGVIEFNLYYENAPMSVSSFVYLAKSGYFDGLTFHRVVPDFVIQGGDPTGTGSGGPGYQFPDEPVVGDYKTGSVAMANAGPDTNGSQFFICLKDQPTLPKQYNLFGQVTEGMSVIDKIEVDDKIEKVEIKDSTPNQ